MSESAVYRPHPEEPAHATLSDTVASGDWSDLHARRFELVSRGDFVPGILYQSEARDPEHAKPSPLLLIQHATADSSCADYLACAAAWAKQGLAVASIDLPLHGRRASPKLSARLIDGVRRLAKGAQLDADTGALVEEFARQSTSDLVRTLDALTSLPEIDGERIGFMGFGLGAIMGSYLLAHDARLRVAVLALVGSGRGPTELDPSTYLEKLKTTNATTSQRPEILIVAAEKDEHVSKRDVDTLYAAAPEPRNLLRSSGRKKDLPQDTLDEIESTLRRTLDF